MEIQGRFEHMNVSSPCYLPNGAPIYRPSGTDPPAPIIPKSYEEKLLGFASAAVNYYNSNHQCRFELLNPLYMERIHSWMYPRTSYYHLSFIARSKDSSGKLKLFFAEVSGGIVKTCTPVEPGNPLFPCGCGTCHPQGVIYHPLGKYEVGSRRRYDSHCAGKLITREESAKKLLCETYIFKDTVQELYPEEDEELRLIVKGYAVKALNWYTQATKCVFELSEPVASVRFGDDSVPSTVLDAKTWVHVTFTARNTDPLCIDASPELFFVELNLDFGWVVTCIKMTQGGSGSLNSEAETSCKVCREVCPMFHPVGKYDAGLCGGTFADAQVKDRSWGAKVELLKKGGTSSNAAGPIIRKSYEEKLFGFASTAVNYYNSNHQCRFELVNPLYMEDIDCWMDPRTSYHHLSFIARSKDSSRKLKLFFAEVSGGIVKTCTPVEPGNPVFPLGCGTCHPRGVIYHPLGKYGVGGLRSYKSPCAGKLGTREESAKKLLCETYSFEDTGQDLYPEEDEELRKIVKGYAVKALNWYRLATDTECVFELSEPVASVRFGDHTVPSTVLDAKTWVHVTFTARNKDPLCIDASPELFFAELNLDFGWVNTCIKMTQAGSGSSNSEAETSCAVCREVCPMFHPEGKYDAGLRGGTFADVQVKDWSWGTKVELQEKLDTSTNAAGEFKLKNSMEVYCHRGIKTLMSTSWTGFNPSGRFWTCGNCLYPCGVFLWFNSPLCQMVIEIISELIRSSRENEAVKSNGGNQTRLGTTWKFLWVCLVIAWMILAWVIFVGNVDEKCSCESRKFPAINGM